MMMILSITMMAITTCYHPVLIFRNVSPLTKMAPRRRLGHYNRSPSYNMVSPNDPTANACKVVDFHGEKIASFNIHGKTMLCLPQAFEIFLKNLVGGLHTVYTKCKRLDIHPLVCNVEQVEKERNIVVPVVVVVVVIIVMLTLSYTCTVYCTGGGSSL